MDELLVHHRLIASFVVDVVVLNEVALPNRRYQFIFILLGGEKLSSQEHNLVTQASA